MIDRKPAVFDRWPPEVQATVLEMRRNGEPVTAMARLVGCSPTAVRNFLRANGEILDGAHVVQHVPPEEIRRRCLEIQATWTAEEEHKRRVTKSAELGVMLYRDNAKLGDVEPVGQYAQEFGAIQRNSKA